MNDPVNAPVPSPEGSAPTPADAPAAPQVQAQDGPPPAAPAADAAAVPAAARRQGNRRRAGAPRPGPEAGRAAPGGAPRRSHPLLEQLGQWYPRLFGAQPLPLKRGIFHDLLAARGAEIDKDALKLALAIHTRSTRYLNAVASGQARHDLEGQSVEAVAPEHVHHALLEVFRRRKPREGEDLQARLRRRIAQAFEASGLTRTAYDALVRGRDEQANALLDEALAEVAERDARAEALLRAFEASGATPEHFADMYGMDRRQVEQSLARARRLRTAQADQPSS